MCEPPISEATVSCASKYHHCNSLPSGSGELTTLRTVVACPACQAKYHLMTPYIVSLSLARISAEIRGCLNFHWWLCHCFRSPMLVKAVGKSKSQFKQFELYSHDMSLRVSLSKSLRVLGGWTYWNDSVPAADLYFPLNLGVFVLACRGLWLQWLQSGWAGIC